MKTLLLIAHGSRRRESNEEVARLAEVLRERAVGRFDYVTHAFLELGEPSIGTAVDDAVSRGASEIVVLPYFLAAGTHVVNDIPGIVAEKQAEHPGVQIRAARYLGTADGLPDILLALAEVA